MAKHINAVTQRVIKQCRGHFQYCQALKSGVIVSIYNREVLCVCLFVTFLFIYGSRSVFMGIHGSRLVIHSSRSVFMVFHGSRLVFHVSRLVFHGFS